MLMQIFLSSVLLHKKTPCDEQITRKKILYFVTAIICVKHFINIPEINRPKMVQIRYFDKQRLFSINISYTI